jgi:hypothetical protein
MKIILTEKQIKSILINENFEKTLNESFFDNINIDDLKIKIKKLLLAGIAISTIIGVINKANISDKEKEELINTTIALEDTKENEIFDEEYQRKVDACREYMEYALRNQNYTLESTGLKPETLVDASIRKNFDLAFLMAVAHQESCFGATARARRTNSVFSVGLWDDGRNMVIYSDPNESVDDYIDLINNSYLVNGKQLLDLLVPNSFVNKDGNRYASDTAYEGKIKYLRNKILKKYPFLN